MGIHLEALAGPHTEICTFENGSGRQAGRRQRELLLPTVMLPSSEMLRDEGRQLDMLNAWFSTLSSSAAVLAVAT